MGDIQRADISRHEGEYYDQHASDGNEMHLMNTVHLGMDLHSGLLISMS